MYFKINYCQTGIYIYIYVYVIFKCRIIVWKNVLFNVTIQYRIVCQNKQIQILKSRLEQKILLAYFEYLKFDILHFHPAVIQF